ncbi:MAG: hypothetical protein V1918_01415 [Planctomycetota bacterium]
MSHTPASYSLPPAKASEQGSDVAKRRLIESLEEFRARRPVAARASERVSAPGEVFRSVQEALQNDPALLNSFLGMMRQYWTQEEALKERQATCSLLEETVKSLEEKLLETISDNGGLHQELDSARDKIFLLRKEIALLTRQRDMLRTRIEALRDEYADHCHALAAAEREIMYLNARFLDERILPS